MLALQSYPGYLAPLQDRLAQDSNNPQNILVYSGRSGMGKTELSKSLFKSLEPNYPVCLWLDGEGIFNFESVRKPIEPTLMQMRSQLSRRGVNLRSFDLAYLLYRSTANPLIATNLPLAGKGKDAAEKVKNSLDLLDASVQMNLGDLAPLFLQGALEVVKEGLPAGKAIATLGWFFMQHSEQIFQWWQERGNRDLRELNDCISPYDILKKLPLFWARDLDHYLRNSRQRGVIFIDGYEKFFDGSAGCDWWEELFLHENHNLLWVIFATERLKFSHPSLKNRVETIPITPLTPTESQQILTENGINDPDICQTIIQASQGIHFYLQVGVETWQNIHQKRQPTIADFASHLSQVLQQRDAAWEPDELRMWQVLANCRVWNQETFEQLMGEFGLEKWQHQLAKITASVYVETADENRDSNSWRLHPLIRRHYYTNQPAQLREAVNTWLATYYQQKYQELSTQPSPQGFATLAETAFHSLSSREPETAINWCLQAISTQQQQGQHHGIIPILEFLSTSLSQNQIFPNSKKLAALSATLLGKSWKALGNYDQALTTLETARSQWQNLGLGESLDAATVELELARLYHQQSRIFDADKASDRALSIRVKLLEENSPEVAEALNNQAQIAASQGLYHQAVQYCDRALAILQSHPDTQPLQLAESKFTAAWLHAYNNNLDAAESLLQESLEIVVNGVGNHHPLAISCQACLGDMYRQMGSHRYQQAYNQYVTALETAETHLGINHPQTLQLLQALANFCRKIGEYDKADEFAQKHNNNVGIGDWEETAEYARRLNNVGYLLLEKGEYGKAESLFKQALQIRLKALEKEHPDTAESLNNLAALYMEQGRCEEAEPLFNQALQTCLKVLGKEHLDTAKTLNNLAALYMEQGRYEEAEPLFKQALQIHFKILGKEHSHTAHSFGNLAALYRLQGRYEEAEPLFNQALQIYLKVLGQEHPDTAKSLNNLAALYRSQGRHEKAEPLFNQALQIYLKVLGKEHPDTANSLNNLGLLYKYQGRYKEAEPLFNQALQIYLKVLGKEHPGTASSLNGLASLYDSQGRYEEAEPLYNQALKIRLKVLGQEHPDTKATENNLNDLRRKMSRGDS